MAGASPSLYGIEFAHASRQARKLGNQWALPDFEKKIRQG
jgi:hypothetical protein